MIIFRSFTQLCTAVFCRESNHMVHIDNLLLQTFEANVLVNVHVHSESHLTYQSKLVKNLLVLTRLIISSVI